MKLYELVDSLDRLSISNISIGDLVVDENFTCQIHVISKIVNIHGNNVWMSPVTLIDQNDKLLEVSKPIKEAFSFGPLHISIAKTRKLPTQYCDKINKYLIFK